MLRFELEDFFDDDEHRPNLLHLGVSEDGLFRSLLGAGVLIAPGNRCFDKGLAKTWFRLDYGTDADSLERGLARFKTVLEEQTDKTIIASPK